VRALPLVFGQEQRGHNKWIIYSDYEILHWFIIFEIIRISP
jgi:hypothetical protein